MHARARVTSATTLDVSRFAGHVTVTGMRPSDTARVWTASIPREGPHVRQVAAGDIATRRKALLRAITTMHATGDRGAFADAALAAYTEARDTYRPDTVPVVYLFSDGRDDQSDIGLDALVERLGVMRDPARPVQVVTVAYGRAPNLAALRAITKASGGQLLLAPNPAAFALIVLDVVARG
jgi:hypothetical protein